LGKISSIVGAAGVTGGLDWLQLVENSRANSSKNMFVNFTLIQCRNSLTFSNKQRVAIHRQQIASVRKQESGRTFKLIHRVISGFWKV
jgi:hypothetical protein